MGSRERGRISHGGTEWVSSEAWWLSQHHKLKN